MFLPEALFLPLPVELQTGFHRREVSRSGRPKTHTEKREKEMINQSRNKKGLDLHVDKIIGSQMLFVL
jgi:hypothetical protein